MTTPTQQLNLDLLLTESVRLTATATHSATTARNYAADWKLYTAWCAAALRQDLPASTETLVLYLTAMMDGGRKIATARRHNSAVNHYHRQRGYPLPGDSRVRALLNGAQRSKHEHPAQKLALCVQDLASICQQMAGERPGVLRDRSILTLGFASALRRSNICALVVEDVRIVAEGLLVEIRHEKQDQRAEGRTIGVARGQHPETCPVLALQNWLRLRGPDAGPLFSRIDHGRITGRRLHPSVIADVVKAGVQSIGLDPMGYAAHSLRAGFVTAAIEGGVSDLVVASQTGHRNLATLKRYYRSTNIWRGNASGMIGL